MKNLLEKEIKKKVDQHYLSNFKVSKIQCKQNFLKNNSLKINLINNIIII